MNKALFIKVFNNIILRKIIFNHISFIHVNILKQKDRYKWIDLIKTPSVMVGNNYIQMFHDYRSRHWRWKWNVLKSDNDEEETNLFSRAMEVAIIVNNREIYNIFVNNKKFNTYQFDRFMEAAVKKGRVEMFKQLDIRLLNTHSQEECRQRYKNLFFISPESRNIEMIHLLLRKVEEHVTELPKLRIIMRDASCLAARYGDIEIIKLLVSKGNFEQDKTILYYIFLNTLIYGNLHCAKWMYPNIYSDSRNTVKSLLIDPVAENGHYECIKFLHFHEISDCSVRAMNKAAANGHLQVVQFLHENRSEGCTTEAMDKAAYYNHFDLVKFLHYNRTEGCTSAAMTHAARHSLEMVKWFHENRTEGCTSEALHNAATNNQLEIVEWLHLNRTERSPDTLRQLIFDRFNIKPEIHIRIIRYLFENKLFERLTGTYSHVLNIFKGAISRNSDSGLLQFLLEHQSELFYTKSMDIDELIEYSKEKNYRVSTKILKQFKK
ncbi:hypothetical protein PPL_11108 [Heterostelium album PN500]|uniref:Ankyrin repeat-containing protein n=1 Tax=Heterostelium pallidum (strain ATCC 26659 / Pp 5 / PN500) TaxID=670386 RepID=D3BSY7_HETP5|nr:hypothetical protein PPL_11108 [Heterostelium album PN500]EFA75602.1 hypothetical protein PPL_11108 [Heterostelium album PN500]|eukprot:XP_020427736.1 hypothetical protein PPL_11108 [Heterostelium album PN500]